MVDMPTDSQGGTEGDRVAGVRAILTLLYDDGFADVLNCATCFYSIRLERNENGKTRMKVSWDQDRTRLAQLSDPFRSHSHLSSTNWIGTRQHGTLRPPNNLEHLHPG